MKNEHLEMFIYSRLYLNIKNVRYFKQCNCVLRPYLNLNENKLLEIISQIFNF